MDVAASPVALISVPYSSARRDYGMGRGPTALLEEHGLAERLSSDGFDVAVDTVEIPDSLVPEIARTFELNRRLASSVRYARAEGAFPIVLSGNCNCSWGATAGAFADEDPAVLWLDAHADFDVPDDNRSGFLDAMALSTLTGRCWQSLAASIPDFRPVPERNVLMSGVRDLDDHQRERLEQSEISVSWGAGDPVLEAFDPESSRLYLHVDLDSLDPSVGQANEFPAPDGLSLGRVLSLQREVVEGFEPVCGAVTAYNPAFDDDGRMARAATEIVLGLARIGTGAEA
ncbi:MAG: arginase [Thermoleophilaceae bacterium]|jgi:arginase|nr:arginase [Thermoleophilaceae bacterium]